MESHELLNAMERTLRPLVDAASGVLAVQDNEADALSLLMTGTHRWRLLLLADSETMADEEGAQRSGLVEMEIKALVQHSEGPLMDVGSSTYRRTTHTHSLLERCTQVRLWFARLTLQRGGTAAPDVWQSDAGALRYTGRVPYIPTAELLSLRTYQMTWKLTAGLLLPDPDTEADALIPVNLS